MFFNFRNIGQTRITILSQQLDNSVKTNSNIEVTKIYLAHKITCVFRHQWTVNKVKFVAFDMFRYVTEPGRIIRRYCIG